jgi:Prenyltransferase and squalene oxidase repeat
MQEGAEQLGSVSLLPCLTARRAGMWAHSRLACLALLTSLVCERARLVVCRAPPPGDGPKCLFVRTAWWRLLHLECVRGAIRSPWNTCSVQAQASCATVCKSTCTLLSRWAYGWHNAAVLDLRRPASPPWTGACISPHAVQRRIVVGPTDAGVPRMWKFVSASCAGDRLHSLNKNQGRQTWEFDPNAGTQEQRREVERLRAEFTANKHAQKHSGDELLRLQAAAKVAATKHKVPTAPLAEGGEHDPDRVAQHLRGGMAFYECLQADDGHFPGDYGGPMFLMPGMIIALYTCRVMDSVLSPQHQAEMLRYLRNHQNDDGGFGLHIEGHSTMFGTALRWGASGDALLSCGGTWQAETANTSGLPVKWFCRGAWRACLVHPSPAHARRPHGPSLAAQLRGRPPAGRGCG